MIYKSENRVEDLCSDVFALLLRLVWTDIKKPGAREKERYGLHRYMWKMVAFVIPTMIKL